MSRTPHIILANGASKPKNANKVLRLHYLENQPGQRIRISLPKFVRNISHVPLRILDLLEIASYVFAADRLISRGNKDQVEFQSWSREIDFYFRVRDYDFWSQQKVKDVLAQVLEFMTGDAKYTFSFEPGHTTPPTNLFDSPNVYIDDESGLEVTLFSGGLDSLCGAIELLESKASKVILVSHQSQSGTTKTQKALFKAIQAKYPSRVKHYSFECTLRNIRAREETQRTRSFLYTSIAYAIATAYGKRCLTVYENGITSLNLQRREDLMNARASRTTHPQTIWKMATLLSMIEEKNVKIKMPYLFLTKSDVIRKLCLYFPELISSTVSCSRTFQVEGEASHCGRCFQCIDRRFAAQSANAEKHDHRGLYTHDIITNDIGDYEAKTTAVDYIRQAISFADSSVDKFENEYLRDLAEILDYLPGKGSDSEKITKIWDLLKRHGTQVKLAINRMRIIYDDISRPIAPNSILGIVSEREYLKPEVKRLADNIAEIINASLGDMFAREKPRDEPDLNEKLGSLLRSHNPNLQSEHPTVSFACANVKPDHLDPRNNIIVEAKYIRDGTSPSKATEGIAADLTKYPEQAFIIFCVYDPIHRIRNDENFRSDIEAKGRNMVIIVR